MVELIAEPDHKVEEGTYRLSEDQAKAILDLKLQRLTGLERDKIHEELRNLGEDIKEFLSILASREKLYGGLRNACYKRLTSEQIDQVCDDVTQSLLKDFEREVDSAVIGERVMSSLRKLDQVAYVRFASVYRQFQDAKDFISEVKGLKR